MEKLTKSVAVKRYLELDAAPISVKEFYEFWRELTPTQKTEYAEDSALMLGVELAASE